MRVAINLALLIALSLINSSYLLASGNEWHGRAEGELFNVTYNQDERTVSIDFRKEHTKIELSGHVARDFIVRDINGDGNDEIIFLDQTGASVGGELRTFYWLAGKVVEVDEEYYANRITLKQYDKRLFVLLWQHDTENLSFCSDVISLQQGKFAKVTAHVVWSAIIMDYRKAVASEKSDWRRSRYYAYMAMAYQNLGDKVKANQLFTKAKKLDTSNPFVNRNLQNSRE